MAAVTKPHGFQMALSETTRKEIDQRKHHTPETLSQKESHQQQPDETTLLHDSKRTFKPEEQGNLTTQQTIKITEDTNEALLIEKEKTKQEYFRSETQTKSLQLFEQAVKYNVPPSLIPLLFANNASDDVKEEIERIQVEAGMGIGSFAGLVQAAAQAAVQVIQSHSKNIASSPSPLQKSIAAQAGAIAAATATATSVPQITQLAAPGTPSRNPSSSANAGEPRLMSPLIKDNRLTPHYRHQRNISMPTKPSDFGLNQSPQRRLHFHTQNPAGTPGIHSTQTAYSNLSIYSTPVHHYSYYQSSQHTPVTSQSQGHSSHNIAAQTPLQPQSRSLDKLLTKIDEPPSTQPIQPSRPTTSMHHVIQFHHWQPTRTPSQTKKEQKEKEKAKEREQERDEPAKKRQRSEPSNTTRINSASNLGNTSHPFRLNTNISTQGSSVRRNKHTRHHSEASIRRDSLNQSFSYAHSGAYPLGNSPHSISKYPFNADTVSFERISSQPQLSPPSQTKSHKHGVDFMIDKEER